MIAQEFHTPGKSVGDHLLMANVDGIALRFRTDGDVASPPLLMANSLGTNLAMWDAQVAVLAKRFRVIRYDSRGHGASDVPPGPYTIDRLGRDALGLMDVMGIERCCFCGLSMGGMVGMWLGANATARVDRLVLCNTAPRIGPPEAWNARMDRVRASGMTSIADAVLDRWFTAPFRQKAPDVMDSMRRMLMATSPEGYIASCAAVRDMDLWDVLTRIDIPTLVISATHDVATPPADGRRMAESIPDARYVELDASHISNVEAPEQFTAELLQFLTA